jgi:hypothetical protein
MVCPVCIATAVMANAPAIAAAFGGAAAARVAYCQRSKAVRVIPEVVVDKVQHDVPTSFNKPVVDLKALPVIMYTVDDAM